VKGTTKAVLLVISALAAWPAAADDELIYRLGGGEPLSLGPSARASTLRLGVGAEWNANLACGSFDIATSIRNQLNGITGAFQEVMGNVIQTAQGVVASLPALAIQRLNPGLYDLLQNGVLEAGQEFRVAKLQCDAIVDDMGDRLAHEGWSSVAKADYWRSQIALGGRDVVQLAEEADTLGTDRGITCGRHARRRRRSGPHRGGRRCGRRGLQPAARAGRRRCLGGGSHRVRGLRSVQGVGRPRRDGRVGAPRGRRD